MLPLAALEAYAAGSGSATSNQEETTSRDQEAKPIDYMARCVEGSGLRHVRLDLKGSGSDLATVSQDTLQRMQGDMPQRATYP